MRWNTSGGGGGLNVHSLVEVQGMRYPSAIQRKHVEKTRKRHAFAPFRQVAHQTSALRREWENFAAWAVHGLVNPGQARERDLRLQSRQNGYIFAGSGVKYIRPLRLHTTWQSILTPQRSFVFSARGCGTRGAGGEGKCHLGPRKASLLCTCVPPSWHRPSPSTSGRWSCSRPRPGTARNTRQQQAEQRDSS